MWHPFLVWPSSECHNVGMTGLSRTALVLLGIAVLGFLLRCGPGVPALRGFGGAGTLSVSSISPSSGPRQGNQTVTLTGTGFVDGVTVSIGSSACTNISTLSETELTCQTPSGNAGTADVTVAGSDAQTATLAGGYSYQLYLVVLNKSASTISVFTIHSSTGVLTPISGSPISVGGTAETGAGDLLGRYFFVANKTSNTFSIFNWSSSGNFAALSSSPFSVGTNPAWIASHPSKGFVYVANEVGNSISGFQLSNEGATPVPNSPLSVTAPKFLTMDAQGRFVFAYNNSDGRVISAIIDQTTGSLTAVSNSAQTVSSLMAADPTGKFLWMEDSGGSVIRMNYDQTAGSIQSFTFAFGPGATVTSLPSARNGQNLYVVLGGSDRVHGCSVSEAGALTELAGSPYSTGDNPATMYITPNEKFAYVPNSSADSVSLFSINSSTGVLTSIGSDISAGDFPIGAAADSNSQFLFVTNRDSDNVSAYTINSATGQLTPVSGSPFPVGDGPTTLVVP